MQEGVRELFGEGRNFASLTTLMADGAPHSVALWTGVEADEIVFVSSRSSRKARNLERDLRVALSVVDLANPYRTARVRGAVVGTIEGGDAIEIVGRLVRRYLGEGVPEEDIAARALALTVYRVRPSYEHFEVVAL